MKKEIDVLKVLDEMDDVRRRRQNDDPDWCMRVLEAILAREAGYESRADWTNALRADVTTKYCKEITEKGCLFNG